MKKTILTIFIIFLISSSGIGLVSAENITETDETLINSPTLQTEELNENQSEESQKRPEEENRTDDRIGENVTALQGGYYNVPFDDGYNGFCVNHALHSTLRGEQFTVKDTSIITSNIYQNESVGNYLKILFTEFYNYTMDPSTNIANAIWAFTDSHYKTSTNPITKQILEMAENGLVVNDHGEIRKINNTTEAIFDFEALDSHRGTTQNFFGYKITYRDIAENEPELGVPEENITEVENNTTELPEENLTEIPENNTTIPEQNTTEIPENNTTIPEQNTTEISENNTTIPEQNTTEIPENNETKLENSTIPSEDEINSTSENNAENISKIDNETQSENQKDHYDQHNLLKHTTGGDLTIVGILILIIGFVLIFKYARD